MVDVDKNDKESAKGLNKTSEEHIDFDKESELNANTMVMIKAMLKFQEHQNFLKSETRLGTYWRNEVSRQKMEFENGKREFIKEEGQKLNMKEKQFYLAQRLNREAAQKYWFRYWSKIFVGVISILVCLVALLWHRGMLALKL